MSDPAHECDIVWPVYNGLTYVRDCMDALLEGTRDCAFRLYIIDDRSDEKTAEFLKQAANRHPEIILHRNSKSDGPIRSLNTGIALGNAPFIACIRSDILVPRGWLSRMIECLKSDPKIACVNPFSNNSIHARLGMIPGSNPFQMDRFLAENSPGNFPDLAAAEGFCMFLRRNALEETGHFDETYGQDVFADRDLSMRFSQKGYRVALADNAYVYRKGEDLFPIAKEDCEKDRKLFEERWGGEYERRKKFPAISPADYRKEIALARHRAWEPSMRETYRRMRQKWRERKPVESLAEGFKGIPRLLSDQREVFNPEVLKRLTEPGALKVTYLLSQLTVSGGVLSVIQLVNEWIRLGVDARIVALQEHPEIYRWKFYAAPILFKNAKEMMENFPETDLLVATHWTTAYWAADLLKKIKAKTGVYFIQDYESWFYPEADNKNRDQVLRSYDLLTHKIVHSDWLGDLLLKDGHQSRKISLGMDLDTFYPRNAKKKERPVILTAARPRSPHRGFFHAVEALKLATRSLPDAEVIFFGETVKDQNIPFAHRDEGLILDRNRLAELYSEADVFLDASEFQGFGRPALEAMSCDAACVLTNVGGVNEYAQNGKNCLLVPAKRPEAMAEAMVSILSDPSLKQCLREGGLDTVSKYCHRREARQTLDYFKEIVAEAPGNQEKN